MGCSVAGMRRKRISRSPTRKVSTSRGPERQAVGGAQRRRQQARASRAHQCPLTGEYASCARPAQRLWHGSACSPADLYTLGWQRWLVASGAGDAPLGGKNAAATCQKRWKVETFRKLLRSNAALGKLPTQTVMTQNNHVFMAIFAMFKLEFLTMRHKLNQSALRAKLLLKATPPACAQLQAMCAA